MCTYSHRPSWCLCMFGGSFFHHLKIRWQYIVVPFRISSYLRIRMLYFLPLFVVRWLFHISFSFPLPQIWCDYISRNLHKLYYIVAYHLWRHISMDICYEVNRPTVTLLICINLEKQRVVFLWIIKMTHAVVIQIP